MNFRLKDIEVSPYDQVITPTYKDVVVATVNKDNGKPMELKMNIYKPKDVSGPTPVLIYIHGGGWEKHDYTQRTQTKLLAWQRPLSLVGKGITVVFIGYRLSQQAIFPAQIHDVKGYVRFLRAHASEYGLDPNRFMAWGQSAGGHLAALLATSFNVSELEGNVGGNLDYSSQVQAVVSLFPVSDFFRIDDDRKEYSEVSGNEGICQVDTPEARLFGFNQQDQGMALLRDIWDKQRMDSPFWEKAQMVNAANPITWVTKNSPPILIVNGFIDELVPWKQSLRLFEAYCRAGAKALYMTDSQMGHFPPKNLEISDAILHFVVEQLFE